MIAENNGWNKNCTQVVVFDRYQRLQETWFCSKQDRSMLLGSFRHTIRLVRRRRWQCCTVYESHELVEKRQRLVFEQRLSKGRRSLYSMELVPSRSSSVLEEDQGMIIKPSGKLEPRTSISMWMPTLLDSMTEPDHDPISIRSKTGYYIINLSKSPLVWKALFKDLSAVTAVKTSTGL